MPSAPPTVLWLPTPPTEGHPSMDRYWSELHKKFGGAGSGEVVIRSPFGAPPSRTARAPRLRRIFTKYVQFPWVTSRQRGMAVAHILDHSCAHLLKFLPASTFKIATVHDLAPLSDDSTLSPMQVRRFRTTVMNLRAADLILADSAHTQADVIQTLGIPAGKIEVLPLGVDVPHFARRAEVVFPELDRFPGYKRILSIGSAATRKNLEALPAILAEVRKKMPEVILLRVGAPLSAAILARLREVMPAEQIIELGNIFTKNGEDPVAAAYQQADVLVIPSSLEGFGLPLLEAMAAGCPVACSNTTALPETGGNAALYFDPFSPAQAAEKIVTILENPVLREELIQRGKARADACSWESHCRTLKQHYLSAAGHSAERSSPARG